MNRKSLFVSNEDNFARRLYEYKSLMKGRGEVFRNPDDEARMVFIMVELSKYSLDLDIQVNRTTMIYSYRQ